MEFCDLQLELNPTLSLADLWFAATNIASDPAIRSCH